MPLLEIQNLVAHYGDVQALFGLDLEVGTGETVAIIGANGAGKTTLMRAIVGILPASPESVRFEGKSIGGMAASDLARRGIALVPEGRRLFSSLSAEEHLKIGADLGRTGPWTLPALFELFPVLREKRASPVTSLSGGQQQMVAIGRALATNPRLLLCDELSLGLAPIVIRDIYAAFPKIRESGASVVIVEQDIGQALKVADRVYCMMEGRITLTGTPKELTRERIHAAYFGVAA